MAERTQLQYQPVQGPVWREPVAEKLAWLPEGQQPARAAPPNRVGDFARPEFSALYQPEGIQWGPCDRYEGQARPYSLLRWYALDPIPPDNPRFLDWQSRDSYSGRSLARTETDTSVYPLQPPVVAYDPENMEWVSLDRYSGKSLRSSPQSFSVTDPTSLIPIPFDPQGLQWMPGGWWQPWRTVEHTYSGDWVVDPTTPPDVIPPQQPGGGYEHFTLRPRNVFIARYVHDIEPIDEIVEPETVFLGAIEKTIAQAEAAPSSIHQEIGLLSALATLSEAYGTHFDSARAAKAAIEQRKGELIQLDEDEIIAMMMIIAATDDPV